MAKANSKDAGPQRWYSPPADDRSDQTNFQLNESILAFRGGIDSTAYGRDSFQYGAVRPYVGIFDFAGLGRLRLTEPKGLNGKTHGVVWPLAEVEVGIVGVTDEEEAVEAQL